MKKLADCWAESIEKKGEYIGNNVLLISVG
jgi:hypothetical protein